MSKVLFIAAFAAGVAALFAFASLVTELIISSLRLKASSIDSHFIRVAARILAALAGIALVIGAADFLGLALAPVLAGLGIGGLAVALAARPTLENVIGGFTLFADRPVKVGDFCRFGNEEGTIEDIGIRSTRIRKRDDTLVSIPNADFSGMPLQNNARRRRWLYRTNIGLRYETTPEQLRLVLTSLREMLVGHPKVSPDTLFVRFKGFGAYSLDLELFAYIRTREWLSYLAIREDINLRITDIIAAAGTSFVFPSQTSYLAHDQGMDPGRSRAAESEVEAWRRNGTLAFPELDKEHEERLEDRLDYPPTGSPGSNSGSTGTAESTGHDAARPRGKPSREN